MNAYDPQSFKDVFDSVLGKNIWNYLLSDDAKVRMLLTTQLGHPAAEGIGDVLLDQFGNDVRQDRVKQAIGHMIRFVMESHGFHLAQRSVKCRRKTELFVYASRYEK